jgi:hypothetical protein
MAKQKKKGLKIQVTTRALIQRINRKLAPDMEKLCVARSERMRLDVGYYHVIDFRMNGVTRVNVDPEAMARELGVLRDFEEMVAE